MDNKLKFSLRKASFLMILKDDFINKLPIPPAFTKIFEGEIPPWFLLELAGTRKCWRVDIEKDESGRLYLGYGFDCFVKAQSLEMGNFLLFEHETPSILEVKIYEKDGSERTTETTFEYEVRAASESATETPITHQEVNASPYPTSHMTSVQYRANKKQRGVVGNGGSGRKKCFVSGTENGVCFSVTWRKANHFLYYLTVPRAMLVGKSFSNDETVMVIDGEGNSWKMELILRPEGRVDFARGWKEFVMDNGLRDGDTLTFEFLSNKVIQVHVQRASQVNDPTQREEEGKNQPSEHINLISEDEELADMCTPSNNVPLDVGEIEADASKLDSSFSFTWTHRTRNSHMHIPKAIVNKQKLKNNDIVILCDSKGKQWLMEVRKQSDGRVGLTQGWSDFTKAYGFGAGDTLIFEFVTDRTMKVNVVKARKLGAIIKQEVLKLD